MSLVIAVKGTEGVVLSADSRLTLTTASGIPATFDNATKLLTFRDPHNWVGALTYGIATIGGRTPHSLIPEFEADLGDQRLTVHEYATRLSGFFQGQWIASRAVPTGDNANFYVGATTSMSRMVASTTLEFQISPLPWSISLTISG